VWGTGASRREKDHREQNQLHFIRDLNLQEPIKTPQEYRYSNATNLYESTTEMVS
jgi:hypothetical protein